MLDSLSLAPLLLMGIASAGLLLVLVTQVRNLQSLPLPPGPPGIPILGNALQIPSEHSWLKFSELADQYGDVVHLTALGRHLILLNSQGAVNDLLVKRGNNYSDRPVLHMAYLSGWKDSWGLLHYGDLLRTTRRLANRVLSSTACRSHIPLQERSALRFVQKMYEKPQNLSENVYWLSASIIMKLVYGHEIAEDGQDKLVDIAERANEMFSVAASPGWLVDIFPALRMLPEWVPGAGFTHQARVWSKLVHEMYHVPFDLVKMNMARSGNQSSFTATLLFHEDGQPVSIEEEEIIRKATGSMYGAAAETTSVTIKSFFLAMVHYPEIQRRAQAEIDAMIGSERLPAYKDRAFLPYIEALVREVHRWNPVVPGGLAHCATEEDVYRGWRIPAQSIVMPNIWKLTHDPTVYPEPLKFKPERFLEQLDASKPGLNPDPQIFTFGFGRRECPGRHLASASVWLAIATTLASFRIVPTRDEDGRDILPDAKYSGGIISGPHEFLYALEVRSPRALSWLQRTKGEN